MPSSVSVYVYQVTSNSMITSEIYCHIVTAACNRDIPLWEPFIYLDHADRLQAYCITQFTWQYDMTIFAGVSKALYPSLRNAKICLGSQPAAARLVSAGINP